MGGQTSDIQIMDCMPYISFHFFMMLVLQYRHGMIHSSQPFRGVMVVSLDPLDSANLEDMLCRTLHATAYGAQGDAMDQGQSYEYGSWSGTVSHGAR